MAIQPPNGWSTAAVSLAKQEEVDGRDYRDSGYAWVHVARFTEKSRFNILWDTNLWGFGCRLSARKPPHYFVYFRTRVMDVACRYTTLRVTTPRPHI